MAIITVVSDSARPTNLAPTEVEAPPAPFQSGPGESTFLTISIDDLELIDRARTDFGDIQEMCNSIKKLGLLNPITVEPVPNTSTPKYRLVAGGRRTRACMILGWEKIPVKVVGHFSEIERTEAELEENLKRKDLTWPERAELFRRIDKLKRQEHGDAYQGSGNKDGWTTEKTAAFVNTPTSTVNNYIKLGEILEQRPDMEFIKELPINQAMKRVKQKLEAEAHEERISTGQVQVEVDLMLGPCQELLDKLEAESFDCLLTDPPFGNQIISAEEGTTRGDSQVYTALVSPDDNLDYSTASKLVREAFPRILRVMKPGAHMYFFCQFDLYKLLEQLAFENNLVVCSTPLIWDKTNQTSATADYDYLPSYEMIFFCQKPPRRSLNNKVRNVLSFPATSAQKKIHVFQKPHDLLKVLIENSTHVGQRILDPFAGSGQTLKSSKLLNRCAIGIEKNRDNWMRAQAYLEEKSK